MTLRTPAIAMICSFLATADSQAQTYSKQEIVANANRAKQLMGQGQYAEAIKILEAIVPSTEIHAGKTGPNLAVVLEALADAYVGAQKHDKAIPLYERCVGIVEANQGKDAAHIGSLRNDIGQAYQALGKYELADAQYRAALKISEKRGPDDANTAVIINSLGSVNLDMAEYAEAERNFLRALKIWETKLGKDHPRVALAYGNLGIVYQLTLDYAKAEPAYLRALEIREAKLGPNHLDVAFTVYTLGTMYHDMGQYAKAEPRYLRGLQLRETQLGKDHHLVGQVLNSMAMLYRDLGQNEKAISLSLRSIAIGEAVFGRDHPDVTVRLNVLANMYREMGQVQKALPIFERVLKTREAVLGKNHPDVAQSLNNLGLLYMDMAMHAEADALLQRNVQICEARFGKDHAQTALALEHLAWNTAFAGQRGKAVALVQQSRQLTSQHIGQVLPSLSEREQLDYLEKTFEPSLHIALSLAVASAKEEPGAGAEWLLNARALVHQTLAQRQLLARDAKAPAVQQIVRDLEATRLGLARLLNAGPKLGQEAAYQNELRQQKAKEQTLSQSLARALGRLQRANAWVALDELRAKIPEQAVFVDIARFTLYDLAGKKDKSPHYVAWITPAKGKGDVQIINLGDAAAIDALVEETRKSLLDSAKSVVKIGEDQAMKTLQKPLDALSAKVLHPLLPALAKYSEWIVCPDGALWLAPWNALRMPGGEFAIEKHLIRHVVSGRDLLGDATKAKAEAAYLFADPDYDLNPNKVATASGVRGIASPLLGQRLRGAIGAWNVSFEFLDNEVVIYDEDERGAVAGKGTWTHEGSEVTIKTGISLFQGKLEGDRISGQRSKTDGGRVVRDTFHLALPTSGVRAAPAVVKTLPRVARLPGTALEAEAVRPHIEKWLGQEPRVFFEEKASEPLARAVKSPRVLIFATHGYFLPAQEASLKDKTALGIDIGDAKRTGTLLDKTGQPIENPFLRCGLLLAGCNKRAEAKPGEDDGILTGLEIVGMDLRGTELVVLSACETGLGDVRSGEGVAGLRQAFQLAGAKGVLASLWQVPDRETALLMNAFYGELTKGKSQAAALREAQLARIASRKASFGAAHPFFWAAFTLTSRGAD